MCDIFKNKIKILKQTVSNKILQNKEIFWVKILGIWEEEANSTYSNFKLLYHMQLLSKLNYKSQSQTKFSAFPAWNFC